MSSDLRFSSKKIEEKIRREDSRGRNWLELWLGERGGGCRMAAPGRRRDDDIAAALEERCDALGGGGCPERAVAVAGDVTAWGVSIRRPSAQNGRVHVSTVQVSEQGPRKRNRVELARWSTWSPLLESIVGVYCCSPLLIHVERGGCSTQGTILASFEATAASFFVATCFAKG